MLYIKLSVVCDFVKVIHALYGNASYEVCIVFVQTGLFGYWLIII